MEKDVHGNYKCPFGCGRKYTTEEGLAGHFAHIDRNGPCERPMSRAEYQRELDYLNG